MTRELKYDARMKPPLSLLTAAVDKPAVAGPTKLPVSYGLATRLGKPN